MITRSCLELPVRRTTRTLGLMHELAKCDVCGNEYWMAFEVRTVTVDVYTFDSFECAIQKLAPRCEHCDCRILGHGVEVEGRFFCCAHCAREGASLGTQIRDTVGALPG